MSKQFNDAYFAPAHDEGRASRTCQKDGKAFYRRAQLSPNQALVYLFCFSDVSANSSALSCFDG